MLVGVGGQDRRPGLLFTHGAHLNSRLRLNWEKELSVMAEYRVNSRKNQGDLLTVQNGYS
jgi:hypothetical protein